MPRVSVSQPDANTASRGMVVLDRTLNNQSAWRACVHNRTSHSSEPTSFLLSIDEAAILDSIAGAAAFCASLERGGAQNGTPCSYVLTGRAGTGKTTTAKELVAKV